MCFFCVAKKKVSRKTLHLYGLRIKQNKLIEVSEGIKSDELGIGILGYNKAEAYSGNEFNIFRYLMQNIFGKNYFGLINIKKCKG